MAEDVADVVFCKSDALTTTLPITVEIFYASIDKENQRKYHYKSTSFMHLLRKTQSYCNIIAVQ